MVSSYTFNNGNRNKDTLYWIVLSFMQQKRGMLPKTGPICRALSALWPFLRAREVALRPVAGTVQLSYT